jgi:hypothetical protein
LRSNAGAAANAKNDGNESGFNFFLVAGPSTFRQIVAMIWHTLAHAFVSVYMLNLVLSNRQPRQLKNVDSDRQCDQMIKKTEASSSKHW